MLKLEIILQIQGELAAALVLELAPKNVADHLADVRFSSLCLDGGQDLFQFGVAGGIAPVTKRGDRSERVEMLLGIQTSASGLTPGGRPVSSGSCCDPRRLRIGIRTNVLWIWK